MVCNVHDCISGCCETERVTWPGNILQIHIRRMLDLTLWCDCRRFGDGSCSITGDGVIYAFVMMRRMYVYVRLWPEIAQIAS